MVMGMAATANRRIKWKLKEIDINDGHPIHKHCAICQSPVEWCDECKGWVCPQCTDHSPDGSMLEPESGF